MQKASWFGVPGRPNGIDQPYCACANRCVGGVDKRQVDRRLGRDGISHVEARTCKTRHERFMSLYVLATVCFLVASIPAHHCSISAASYHRAIIYCTGFLRCCEFCLRVITTNAAALASAGGDVGQQHSAWHWPGLQPADHSHAGTTEGTTALGRSPLNYPMHGQMGSPWSTCMPSQLSSSLFAPLPFLGAMLHAEPSTTQTIHHQQKK